MNGLKRELKMDEKHLTHKEIALDLKDIKAALENLQSQIKKNKQEFLAHIEGDNINLE